MTDQKFHIISEKKIGTLDETMRAEWDRLYEQQNRLMRETAEQEDAMDAFHAALQDKFQQTAPDHNGDGRYRISPEGDVLLEFCTCPPCQAQVHGLTVEETVQKLVENDFIPGDAAAVALQRARALDVRLGMRKKLMN